MKLNKAALTRAGSLRSEQARKRPTSRMDDLLNPAAAMAHGLRADTATPGVLAPTVHHHPGFLATLQRLAGNQAAHALMRASSGHLSERAPVVQRCGTVDPAACACHVDEPKHVSRGSQLQRWTSVQRAGGQAAMLHDCASLGRTPAINAAVTRATALATEAVTALELVLQTWGNRPTTPEAFGAGNALARAFNIEFDKSLWSSIGIPRGVIQSRDRSDRAAVRAIVANFRQIASDLPNYQSARACPTRMTSGSPCVGCVDGQHPRCQADAVAYVPPPFIGSPSSAILFCPVFFAAGQDRGAILVHEVAHLQSFAASDKRAGVRYYGCPVAPIELGPGLTDPVHLSGIADSYACFVTTLRSATAAHREAERRTTGARQTVDSVLGPSSGGGSRTLQRDLALEPTVPLAQDPALTPERVRRAISYNRATYKARSTRLIQDVVGAPGTGAFDETTVLLIARLQADFGLRPDGKVDQVTFDLIMRELNAEGAAPGTCLILFQIVGPEPLRFFRNSPTTGTIDSRFFVRAQFDPRCHCEEFEYRQFIAGNVVLRDHAGPTFSWNSTFAIPGGGLSPTFKEDGNTAVPAGVAGHRYGHRRHAPNPSDDRDEYLPNRRTGCRYEARDFPHLGPIPAAAGDTGDAYDWEMRFRGVIRRAGIGVVEEKYWAIRDTIVIPAP